MGLLGEGWDDPKSMATLQLAAGLLGPGSFGQALGRGLSGYQGALENAVKQRVATMQADKLQREVEDEAAARQVLKDFYAGNGMPKAASAPGTGPGLPASVAGSLPPEFQTGAKVGAMPGYQPPAKVDLYSQYQNLGQQMAARGLHAQAKAYFDTAEKFRPKYSTTPQQMMVGGKLTNVLVSEDGSLKTLDGFDVKPDMVEQDLGDRKVWVNKNTLTPGQAFQKNPEPWKDLLVRGADGQLVQNNPLVAAKSAVARAGAAQVNVNTDKSYFGNVAEGLAKGDVATIDAARSAPDRINSSLRIKEILKQNPITGTGASALLAVNKAFATAGLIDPSKSNATEALVSELAGQTLDSIKTSGLGSGQGFTDKDRQFLQDARSGRIELNPATIGRIADLNEKSARSQIQRGNAVIGRLKKSPESGAMGQQLEFIAEPGAVAATGAPAAPGKTVVKTGMYGGKKVIQYSDGSVDYAN